jgi:hypothetical protein
LVSARRPAFGVDGGDRRADQPGLLGPTSPDAQVSPFAVALGEARAFLRALPLRLASVDPDPPQHRGKGWRRIGDEFGREALSHEGPVMDGMPLIGRPHVASIAIGGRCGGNRLEVAKQEVDQGNVGGSAQTKRAR